MDLVARAAHISKGTLYARFAGKDTLLLAVIDDLLGQLQARASAHDATLPSELAPRLREYARRLVQVMGWDEYRSLFQLTQSAARVRPDLSWSWQKAATAGYVETVARAMQASAPEVLAEPSYWQHLATMLLHAVGGWYQSESATGPIDPDRFDAYCEVVVTALVSSIEQRRTTPGMAAGEVLGPGARAPLP